MENVFASKGGAVSTGSFRNWLRVTARGGALPASGVGNNEKAVLPGLISFLVSTKKVAGLMVAS